MPTQLVSLTSTIACIHVTKPLLSRPESNCECAVWLLCFYSGEERPKISGAGVRSRGDTVSVRAWCSLVLAISSSHFGFGRVRKGSNGHPFDGPNTLAEWPLLSRASSQRSHRNTGNTGCRYVYHQLDRQLSRSHIGLTCQGRSSWSRLIDTRSHPSGATRPGHFRLGLSKSHARLRPCLRSKLNQLGSPAIHLRHGQQTRE